MNELAIKLVTGELLMCTSVASTDTTLTIAHPIEVSTIQLPSANGIVERTTTTDWCTITAMQQYTIHRAQIVFAEPLKESIAVYYRKLVTHYKMQDTMIATSTGINQLHDFDNTTIH